MKLYLARHCESMYNQQHMLNADPSVIVDLTPRGIEQAKGLAQKLANEKFEVIYVSELVRTHQTANIVNEKHHVPMIVDGRLNDNASGFEGKPAHEYLKALDEHDDMWRVALNDGESLEQARNRAASFLEDLKKTTYSAVLIVTHGYVIEAMYGILHHLPIENSVYTIPQGDYATFEI